MLRSCAWGALPFRELKLRALDGRGSDQPHVKGTLLAPDPLRLDRVWTANEMRAHSKPTRREVLAASGALVLASPASRARADAPGLAPFSYHAPAAALADLRRRLEETRWPERETGLGWEQGPPLAQVQDLVAYWRTNYEWRRCETELKQWPQFKTAIDGLGIHFMHVRSRHPNALPLILTHGW